METRNNPEILVKRAQSGEREAFDSLVRIHEERLQRHVTTRVGRHLRSSVEVEDVVQDVFTRAWQSIDTFRWTGEGSFLRWLKGIAENAILKHARQQGRSRVLYRQAERESNEPTPSKNLRREERLDRLEEALKRLSPEYREAVLLVRIEGCQIKEAARRMNRTPKAVMHLVSRALKKLREDFGDTESLHLPPGIFRGDEAEDGVAEDG